MICFVGQKRLIIFQLFLTNYDLFCRSKEIDWMPYFTQRMVDDFASHIRLYRRAMDKAKSVTVANKEGTYEPHYEKTCIRGFRLGSKQTKVYNLRRWLEA